MSLLQARVKVHTYVGGKRVQMVDEEPGLATKHHKYQQPSHTIDDLPTLLAHCTCKHKSNADNGVLHY